MGGKQEKNPVEKGSVAVGHASRRVGRVSHAGGLEVGRGGGDPRYCLPRASQSLELALSPNVSSPQEKK